MIDYCIRKTGKHTSKVGELVSMLEHTRAVTIAEIKDLTKKQLDYLVDDTFNSIGSLLLHISFIAFVHEVMSFEGRNLNEVEYKKWQSALELGEKARKNISNLTINDYLEALSEVRERTIIKLKEINDDWLFQEKKWENGVIHINYYLWFHVMEEEMSHRGQIRTIIRTLVKNSQHLYLGVFLFYCIFHMCIQF